MDNSTIKAPGSARSISFYPVSLEVTCPSPPHLFAVPSAVDGSVITKAGFGFSFVLKIFETRGRNPLLGVPFSEVRQSSGRRGAKGVPSCLSSPLIELKLKPASLKRKIIINTDLSITQDG